MTPMSFHGAASPNGVTLVRFNAVEDPITWRSLPARHDLRGHVAHGFEWGYIGELPLQLAVAILALVANDDAAIEFQFSFVEECVSKFPREGFELSAWDVRWWLMERQADTPFFLESRS